MEYGVDSTFTKLERVVGRRLDRRGLSRPARCADDEVNGGVSIGPSPGFG
jgi:hypothetical protein